MVRVDTEDTKRNQLIGMLCEKRWHFSYRFLFPLIEMLYEGTPYQCPICSCSEGPASATWYDTAASMLNHCTQAHGLDLRRVIKQFTLTLVALRPPRPLRRQPPRRVKRI